MKRLIIFLQPYSCYLLVVWAITIIVVSSIPSIPTLKIHTPKAEIRLDYLMHLCEYGFLSFLAFMSFVDEDFQIGLKKVFLITISLFLFAIVDEFHQKIIPGRSFNYFDIVSNLTGIIAGLIFCLIMFRVIIMEQLRSSELQNMN